MFCLILLYSSSTVQSQRAFWLTSPSQSKLPFNA